MILLLWTALTAGLALATEPQRTRFMAASSLTDVLPQAAKDFVQATGIPEPMFAFSGSSTLAKQAASGAKIDGLILAHPQWMTDLADQGWVGEQTSVLSNELVVVVPRGSTHNLQTLADLGDEHFERIAIARPEVPAGRYASQALKRANVFDDIQDAVVRAPHVRAALGMAATGVVDVAFVYRSDALMEPRVQTAIVIPDTEHDAIRYIAALTTRGQEDPHARAFLDFLQGEAAAAHFTQAGFGHLPTSAPAEYTPIQTRPAPIHTADIVLRTIGIAGASLALTVLPALWFGWLMARRTFAGKALVSTILLSPLVIPPVVTGWLLLQILGPYGPLGGLDLAFTKGAAVIAGAVVGFPLFLILARQAFESVDVRYPRIAETLGLKPSTAFFRVTLPMALPGIAAGAILAFARALGEFGATAMVAGDMPGHTRTLALAVYALAEQPGGSDASLTLVGISLFLAFIALVIYERLVRRQRHQSGPQQ